MPRSQTVLPVRVCAGRRQAPHDFADRGALPSDPLEDLAHHTGLLRHDLEAGCPATLVPTEVPVTVGCAGEHTHDASLRAVPLTTPAALEDLGPLILGHHPLDL